jgi:hypothetical protein
MHYVVCSSPNAWQCGLWWSTPYSTLEDLMLIPRKVFPQGVKILGAKALYLDLITFCMALRNFISQLFPGDPYNTDN